MAHPKISIPIPVCLSTLLNVKRHSHCRFLRITGFGWQFVQMAQQYFALLVTTDPAPVATFPRFQYAQIFCIRNPPELMATCYPCEAVALMSHPGSSLAVHCYSLLPPNGKALKPSRVEPKWRWWKSPMSGSVSSVRMAASLGVVLR